MLLEKGTGSVPSESQRRPGKIGSPEKRSKPHPPRSEPSLPADAADTASGCAAGNELTIHLRAQPFPVAFPTQAAGAECWGSKGREVWCESLCCRAPRAQTPSSPLAPREKSLFAPRRTIPLSSLPRAVNSRRAGGKRQLMGAGRASLRRATDWMVAEG